MHSRTAESYTTCSTATRGGQLDNGLGMERQLFSKFKMRRTRGRKCSPKCLTYDLLTLRPDEAEVDA